MKVREVGEDFRTNMCKYTGVARPRSAPSRERAHDPTHNRTNERTTLEVACLLCVRLVGGLVLTCNVRNKLNDETISLSIFF